MYKDMFRCIYKIKKLKFSKKIFKILKDIIARIKRVKFVQKKKKLTS